MPLYTMFITSIGNFTQAVAYSEVTGGTPYHQLLKDSGTAIAACNWTGMKLINANTTSPSAAQTYASFTFSAVTKATDDTLQATWRFYFDGTDFTTTGFSRAGHLAFDSSAHGYAPFNYVSCREPDDTEWKRVQNNPVLDGSNQYFATYDMETTFTPDASSPQVDKIRLYNASSGGDYLCELATIPTVPIQGTNLVANLAITLIN